MTPLVRDKPERRLLDESRRTRGMLWVMAIMLFLTVLAAARVTPGSARTR